jgi:hypothetical protein
VAVRRRKCLSRNVSPGLPSVFDASLGSLPHALSSAAEGGECFLARKASYRAEGRGVSPAAYPSGALTKKCLNRGTNPPSALESTNPFSASMGGRQSRASGLGARSRARLWPTRGEGNVSAPSPRTRRGVIPAGSSRQEQCVIRACCSAMLHKFFQKRSQEVQ